MYGNASQGKCHYSTYIVVSLMLLIVFIVPDPLPGRKTRPGGLLILNGGGGGGRLFIHNT